jgi:hypothetical protein
MPPRYTQQCFFTAGGLGPPTPRDIDGGEPIREALFIALPPRPPEANPEWNSYIACGYLRIIASNGNIVTVSEFLSLSWRMKDLLSRNHEQKSGTINQ